MLRSLVAGGVALGDIAIMNRPARGLLPDWLEPMAWGFGMILPPSCAVLWAASARSPAGMAGLFSTFGVSGGVLGWLFYDYRCGVMAAKRDVRAAEFRLRLIGRLRSHSADRVDFPAFAAECGINRAEADQAAGAVYAMMCAEVMDRNGLLADRVRYRLDKLSRSLEIAPRGAEHIEACTMLAARREGYRAAMGSIVVTAEETQALAELRQSLGLQDEHSFAPRP